jgi:uncharacterized membrane protein
MSDLPPHPGLAAVAERRAQHLQARIADRITAFAGSMTFVYVHIVWFAIWIASGVEKFPFGFLTMVVSLEAIFLSTFVMISQNRQDEARQAFAAHEFQMVQEEKHQNEELLVLSEQILELTREVHKLTARPPSH